MSDWLVIDESFTGADESWGPLVIGYIRRADAERLLHRDLRAPRFTLSRAEYAQLQAADGWRDEPPPRWLWFWQDPELSPGALSSWL